MVSNFKEMFSWRRSSRSCTKIIYETYGILFQRNGCTTRLEIELEENKSY